MMVAKNLFRPRPAAAHQSRVSTASPETPCEKKLIDYEEQLAYLSQQKELHTLALKEMYQFLCKLDTSFRKENQKLRDLIDREQSRSEKLIEVTKGLWEIIELMDDGQPAQKAMASALTREVEELANIEIEIMDESDSDLPGSIYPEIAQIAPMMAAVR